MEPMESTGVVCGGQLTGVVCGGQLAGVVCGGQLTGQGIHTHGADEDNALQLSTLILQQGSQQLHPRPSHMEIKLLQHATSNVNTVQ